MPPAATRIVVETVAVRTKAAIDASLLRKSRSPIHNQERTSALSGTRSVSCQQRKSASHSITSPANARRDPGTSEPCVAVLRLIAKCVALSCCKHRGGRRSRHCRRIEAGDEVGQPFPLDQDVIAKPLLVGSRYRLWRHSERLAWSPIVPWLTLRDQAISVGPRI